MDATPALMCTEARGQGSVQAQVPTTPSKPQWGERTVAAARCSEMQCCDAVWTMEDVEQAPFYPICHRYQLRIQGSFTLTLFTHISMHCVECVWLIACSLERPPCDTRDGNRGPVTTRSKSRPHGGLIGNVEGIVGRVMNEPFQGCR